MDDPFGEAIRDYFEKGKAPKINVNSNYTENEEILPSYFFRSEKEMPEIEQKALKFCRGKILDVGAAAGCHSLILQKKGFNITAIEKSSLAAEVLNKRGIQKVINDDIYSFSGNTFDTILLLMNGTGIGESISGLEKLLNHLKELLSKDGQILIDSSDIKYLFEENDGTQWVELSNSNYYGEMEYEVTYKKSLAKFKWLFVDFETLQKVAEKVGLDCQLAAKGEHFDFLARIKLKA